ncbi:LysR family transcriptional regulator [Paenibacillus abyssi]|uniref:LysR family transcriptional regulator n=2 Tax=Paenibacillus abyssi TaxID=1340531 RepID=A0A917FTB7_9BACL|nr:LysR family transcriptional regulator [Paenibacillus abyssi]GGG06579.1 LysR family transcriptional regulator [Paenibacillus abyssi]
MDWMDIHYFVTVVREQSISKASRILHISQPTLTARLKKLEAEFNTPLLERNWKGVELTMQGHQFLLYAVQVLDEFKEMSEKLHELIPDTPAQAEKLKLGVLRPLGPYFISPALQLLKQDYPDIKYDVITGLTGYLMELISVRKIHLGIMPYFKPFPGLSSVTLFQEEIVLLAPKKDPLRTELATGRWKSHLLSRPFYLYGSKFPFRKIIDCALHDLLGQLPDVIHEVNDTNTLVNLASTGFGYTILPASYIYDAFDLQKLAREPLGHGFSVIDHKNIPYTIFFLPSFPTRALYLVYPDNWDSELPLRQIVQDIASVYQTNEALHFAKI